jgi:hypothetical protein
MVVLRSRDCYWCLALDRSLVLALIVVIYNMLNQVYESRYITHTYSEPSATFNMSHMLFVILDSNNIDRIEAVLILRERLKVY